MGRIAGRIRIPDPDTVADVVLDLERQWLASLSLVRKHFKNMVLDRFRNGYDHATLYNVTTV